MSGKTWLRAVVAMALALLVSVPAMAQVSATTGAIEGRVTSVDGAPIQGVTVVATGGRAPLTATTNADGYFLIANLQSGEYELRLSKPGYGTIVQKGIAVNVTGRRFVPFVLTAGQTELVTVTADAPIVDPKSTTIGGTFNVSSYVNYLPIGRNFSNTFTLAPGVESGGQTGTGNNSISGSSGLENSYLVDGVNITNGGYGGLGTYSNVYGSLGVGVTYDFLEEVQVKTGAIDAEYGQATGGVINTVVKSGTNSFSGAIGAYVVPKGWTSSFTQIDTTQGAVNQQTYSQVDIGGSVGGPIVKDKVFYFIAYNPVRTKEEFTIEDQPIVPSQVAGYPSTGFATAGKTLERERSSDNYAGKLTWYLNPNHRVEGTVFGDPSHGPTGPQRISEFGNLTLESPRFLDYYSGGGQSRISYGSESFTAKYDGVITPSFFVQAQISHKKGHFNEDLALNKPTLTDVRALRCSLGLTICPPDNIDGAIGTTWAWGGAGFIAQQDDRSWQYKAQGTWVVSNNELKFGVDYYDLEFAETQIYPGDSTDFLVPLDVDADGDYDTQGLGLVECAGDPATSPNDCAVRFTSNGGYLVTGRADTDFRVTRTRFNPTPPPTTSNEINLFAQDTLSLGTRWNLKLGLRVTQQEIKGAGTYSIPFERIPNPTSPALPIRVPGSTTYTGKEYKFDWAFAPRIGATFDVRGDGTSKVYGNVARYFERIPNDLAIRALSNEVGLSRYRYGGYDIPNYMGTNPLNGNVNTAIFFQGIDEELITPGTKLPYVDEIVAGYQQEISRDFSLEIRAIYREQGRSLEDVQYNSIESIQNFYYGPAAYGYPFDPFPGFGVAPFGAYVIANPGDNTEAGIPFAERKYKAIELIANKRFADNWLFYGNFRWSRLRGNYEGLYRNDNQQDDPNITSLFDFPNSPLLSSQFDIGPLFTDRPYVLKLYGSYQWSNGLTAGAALNWSKGTPRTSMLAHPNYQNAGELPGLDPIYAWWTGSTQAELEAIGASAVQCDAGSGLCLAKGTAEQNGLDGNVASGFFLYDYTRAKRGNLGNTPDLTNVDVNLNWTRKLKKGTLLLGVAVQNLFNAQNVIFYNDNVEFQATIPEPDYGKVRAYNDPRIIRVNARWSF